MSAPMFGPKALALPSPFAHEHRPQHLYSEPARPQPAGQCHYRVGSKEQRCPCQGYQHNRTAPGSICDCAHAACYHAHSITNETGAHHNAVISNGPSPASLLDRIKKLEEIVQLERDIRDNILARERQAWERELRVLREALSPFYTSEAEMQHKLVEIDDKIADAIKDQRTLNTRLASVEAANAAQIRHNQTSVTVSASTHQHLRYPNHHLGPRDALAAYSGNEGQMSISAESSASGESAVVAAMGPESPRSSGILNLVELPRPALPRYNMPARLSPPAESDEPRSSGFLALDVKEIIQRRKLASRFPPGPPYGSPSSSATKSPSTLLGNSMTPQSLPRISPPTLPLSNGMIEMEDKNYKKRKHQVDLMALDVLADVSAASPVIS